MNNDNKPNLDAAMAVIYDAIKQDRLFASRFLEKIDRKTLESFINKPRLNPYPADVETVELSIWDNDFGKKASKMDARYKIQVKANRKGNTNLGKRDFSATAKLYTPAKIRRLSKDWALSPDDKSTFADVVAAAESGGYLIGRLMLVIARQGSHIFENHYVLVSPIDDGAPRVVLSLPCGNSVYDADKTTDAKGNDFTLVHQPRGLKSKVIYQSRNSKAASLSGWSK